jgi:hypothetical protein
MLTSVTNSNLTQFKVLTVVYTIIFKINKCSNCVHHLIFQNIHVCLYSNSGPTERVIFNGYNSASSHRLSMGVPKQNKQEPKTNTVKVVHTLLVASRQNMNDILCRTE